MEVAKPSSTTFTIYSKTGCTYCVKVKDLLKEFEKDYIEVNCDEFLDNKEEFLQTIQTYTKKPYKTFPMVFDKETFVGGFIDTIKYLDTDN